MKFSLQIVLLVTLIFWYSATVDLTVADLYSHFCFENSTLNLPEALSNTSKTGFQIEGLVIANAYLFIYKKQLGFYLKSVSDFIPKLQLL